VANVQETIDRKVAELEKALGVIELKVTTEGYTLADAMREGTRVTAKATGGWGNGDTACGWTSAFLAAKARGLIE
jgi:hypothetical protein